MATLSPATTVRWLLAPATDEVPRFQAVGATTLRMIVGLLWLYNVAWKRAPDFGQDAENGLFKFTSYAVSDPVLPPFSWVVEHVVLPNFALFGWGVLLAESTLAVLLLTGAWVRLAAAIGIAQSVAIALSVAFAPHEWPWSYWLMIGAHLLLLLSSAGRILAVDAIRAGLPSARETLARVWGVIAVLTGLFSLVQSFDDPLAPRGPGLGRSDISISLGEYNLVGALVLIVIGILLLVPAKPASLGAAALAALGGLSLHAQLGFSDPVLGGSATSAAFLFALAVVAGADGAHAPESRTSPAEDPARQAAA